MILERSYYTKALRRAELEEQLIEQSELKALWAQVVAEAVLNDTGPRPLDHVKAAWFEGFSEAVQIFAETCGLNVKMWIGIDHCGYIEFETSYFELSDLDPPEIHGFWRFLCENGDLSILPMDDTFVIKFRFILHST